MGVPLSYPRNYGISEIVVWRSQNPALQTVSNISFLEGPMILRVEIIYMKGIVPWEYAYKKADHEPQDTSSTNH